MAHGARGRRAWKVLLACHAVTGMPADINYLTGMGMSSHCPCPSCPTAIPNHTKPYPHKQRQAQAQPQPHGRKLVASNGWGFAGWPATAAYGIAARRNSSQIRTAAARRGTSIG